MQDRQKEFVLLAVRRIGIPVSAMCVISLAVRVALRGAAAKLVTIDFALSALAVFVIGVAASFLTASFVWSVGLWPGSRDD